MKLSELDKRYVWHPYTQMKDWPASDIRVIKKGRGSWLIDTECRRYLDGVASMWCNVWGHTRPEIIRAMMAQIRSLQHSTLFGLANEPSVTLARMLVGHARRMSKVFYSDNGSTAVEVALKMALQYWRNTGRSRRNLFIALRNGYHGDTVGAMSVGYIESFFANYRKMLFTVKRTPSPYLYRRPRGMGEDEYVEHCIDSVEWVLKRENDRIAGVIMESGAQVAGGAIIYPRGYQREVARLCRKHDALLILDEVATGLGRLGSMIEYIQQGSVPDIAVFGKMLTAGYLPLAATLATDRIYNAFLGEYEERKHLFHGHTFTGNPLACATAIANLKLYDKERLLESVRRKSRIMQRRLEEFSSLEIVGDVRQKGMLAGIELVSDRRSRKPLKAKGKRINYMIMRESLRRGVFLRPLGHIMLLVPPLAVSEKELGMLLDTAVEIVRYVQRRV